MGEQGVRPIDNRWIAEPLRCDNCDTIIALPHADGGFRVMVDEPIVTGDGRVVMTCPGCGKRIRKRPGRQAA